MRQILLALLLIPCQVFAEAKQLDEFRWEGVDRIVAIGDLHGDYDNYIATLKAAGLVDRKGKKWTGGATHLVQTGDIPDRGPDTRRMIEHIDKLAKQAKRKGGRVHLLLGNHEAMNSYGDLRYVHPGEFEAFVDRNSSALRDRYFEVYMQNLEAQDPDRFATLPENFREQWNEQIPLGWVEHRQAWDPLWNPDGEFAERVVDLKVAIRINGFIFLHGGISSRYCQNTLEWMTQKAQASLSHFDPRQPGLIEDDFGPLWYRGLSGVEPHATMETVDAILQHQGARHIVVGHTPTSGVIWPRYDAKVIMIDTGISSAYGGYVGYLEITDEGMFGGYPEGKLRLPEDSEGLIPYLEQVMAWDSENDFLKQRHQILTTPQIQPEVASDESGEAPTPESAGVEAGEEFPAPEPEPSCGISQ